MFSDDTHTAVSYQHVVSQNNNLSVLVVAWNVFPDKLDNSQNCYNPDQNFVQTPSPGS